MADLLINDTDALSSFGVRMGAKFIDTLFAPVPLKSPIENESRATHGKQLLGSPYLASRQISLEFTIQGDTPEEFETHKASFYTALYNGWMSICVPPRSEEIFHLWYLGTTPTYAASRNGCFAKVMIKFEEPDPSNRS